MLIKCYHIIYDLIQEIATVVDSSRCCELLFGVQNYTSSLLLWGRAWLLLFEKDKVWFRYLLLEFQLILHMICLLEVIIFEELN
jgi:hypothetical protein